MKKFFAFFLCLCMTLLFVGCGQPNNNPVPNPPVDNPPVNPNPDPEPDPEPEPEPEPNPNPDPVVPENEELFICIPENKELKVLQMADIHFGVEGKDWHNDKVERTKLYMDYLVETEKPDLIVCSGDNILQTGTKGINEFITLIEKYEIPWIWVYGNHDSESEATNYRKVDLSNALVNADTKYLLYKHGYVEDGYEDRYGNFSISIYNPTKEKLLGAFIIFDSGEFDYSKNYYQTITPGQIDWYKTEIDKLQEQYVTQTDNKYEVIPTVVFSHIQIPEFITAFEKAQKNDGAKFIIEQDVTVNDIEGGPTINNGLFDVLVEKGSTKAYFVGHAHTLYFQVEMNGIVLGFGPQTGFSKLFANNDAPRKTHLYTFKDDLTFTTKQCIEIVKNKGLAYSSSNGSGNASYNPDTGNYSFTVQLGLWDRVTMDYYGPEITSEYTRITYNNTKITGEIRDQLGADWTTKLYVENFDSGVFLCSHKVNKIYKFVYNPTSNTLDISLVEQIQLQPGQIQAYLVNKNSDLTVWKNSGFKIKNGNNWCSSTAKLFIIVDAEGRIVYAVYYPQSGSGDPKSSTYYTHPFYEDNRDYQTNPAIVMKEDNYNLVVPEGGFAITVSGAELLNIGRLIYSQTIDSANELMDINNRLGFDHNLRLKFDLETKVISTYYVE